MFPKLSTLFGITLFAVVHCDNLQSISVDVAGIHRNSADFSLIEDGRPRSSEKSLAKNKPTHELKFASARRGAKHFDRHVANGRQTHLLSDDTTASDSTTDSTDPTTASASTTDSTDSTTASASTTDSTDTTTTSAPTTVSTDTTTASASATDSTDTTTTSASTVVTTASTSTTVSTTVVVYSGTWTNGDYGLCRANCGSGYMYRDLHCLDASSVEIEFTNCDPALRPVSRQACVGDCLSCDVNAMFFKGIGVADSPQFPLPVPLDSSEVICRVEATSAVRCCDDSTEEGIQVVISQLKRGLTAQTQHRDTTIDRIGAVYQNVTNVLSARLTDIGDATDAVNSALDDTPSALASADQTLALTNLRNGLSAALDMRTNALQTALSDLATAQDELLAQMDAMNSLPDDDTPPEDTGDDSSGSSLVLSDDNSGGDSEFSDAGDSASMLQIHHDPKKMSSFLQRDNNSTSSVATPLNFSDPTLRIASKLCEATIEDFFIGLSCSACNPLFPILAPEPPEKPSIRIPASQCTSLFTACSDTLIEAHQHMVNGVQALLNSHGNLITVVAQVQPILDLVWSELRFDWLPGFAAQQVAKPDLTKMACIQELKVFQPYPVNTAADFCNAYLSFASTSAFVQRIGVQIDRGVFAMAKFTSCDRCLHETIMFLVDVLGSSAHGSLRISLPNRTQAMLSSCGSAMPKRKGNKSVKLMKNASKMTTAERISPRIFYPSPNVTLKSLSYYANITAEILEDFNGLPPHEWTPRSLMTDANTTRVIPVSENSLMPVGPDAEMLIHVMNLNCTQHTDCYHQDAPSGIRPWWFCAHPNVCTLQPGACTAEAEGFFVDGPKCVRGPCMNDESAIDQTCPDNALCPSDGGASLNGPASPTFDMEYFARFDLKIRNQDPTMTTVTQGVCDCAFGSNGAVVDQCEYARCLAYASLVENSLTCTAELVNQCVALLQNPECQKDGTLDCTNSELILTYPPPLPNECAVSNFALSDDTKDAPLLHMGALLLVLLSIAV